jgi:DNA-binding GntR family transcriptional regulator
MPRTSGAPGNPQALAAAVASSVPRAGVFLTAGAGALPSRTVAVLEAIKHAILAGELTPGRPLVETDLAEMLGVSKTPVREALKTLAGAGLVTMSPYKGAAVRVVDGEQARHVYDARLLIEPEALRRAVAAGHDWAAARAALAAADSAHDQAERSLANRDFHRALYAGCGNPLLVRMLDDLRDATALIAVASWQHDPPGSAVPSWEREAAEHQAILAAAEGGDPGRAAGLLRAHIAAFFTRNFPGAPAPPPPAPPPPPRRTHSM